MAAQQTRQTGRVKFFNSTKGYGFIIPDDPSGQGKTEDVFVHHTAIYNNGGFKSLGEGEEVEYDLVQGPKGMQAANVSGPGGAPVRGDPYAGYIRNSGFDNPRFANGGGGGAANSGNVGYGYPPPFGYPVPIYGGGFVPYGTHFYMQPAPPSVSSPSQQPPPPPQPHSQQQQQQQQPSAAHPAVMMMSQQQQPGTPQQGYQSPSPYFPLPPPQAHHLPSSSSSSSASNPTNINNNNSSSNLNYTQDGGANSA
ncbi:hypothetical protein VTP01DRAFT_10447 [Rhizomucor pusillus]|uniref:uncharacterized protein n=1 Tax=Rhizomucor pusillus TaxID=4840 RepID=UPI0037433443